MRTIGERLKIVAGHFGRSIRAFERDIGVSNGYVKGLKSAPSAQIAEDILQKYPEVSREWLLTGEGEMLNSSEQTGTATIADTSNYTLVPLYNLDVVGGMDGKADSTDIAQYIERRMLFDGARAGDFCIYVSGNSMSPTYPSGTIVLCREVQNWREFFGFGSVFALDLKDGRRLLKEVRSYAADTDKYVLCVSHNEDYDAEPLPREFIQRVYKVVAALIRERF